MIERHSHVHPYIFIIMHGRSHAHAMTWTAIWHYTPDRFSDELDDVSFMVGPLPENHIAVVCVRIGKL
jgi:hypothetical protein